MISENNNIYKINKYITLKLENNKTNIYIDNERFIQCKFLLINVTTCENNLFDKISSIDDVSDILDRSMENNKESGLIISPETEFWGHCSNLQVWCENNYDTQILHRNLAFPLLKKLTEKGDIVAKKVFKEEIARRFASGNSSVRNYLMEEDYLNYLNEEELNSLLLDIKGMDIDYIIYTPRKLEFINNGALDLKNLGLDDFTKIVGLERNKRVKELDLINNRFRTLPESLGELKSLEKLFLDNNNLIVLPESIGKLKSLQELSLRNNYLAELPKTIGKLQSLQSLDLTLNKLTDLPATIGTLKELQMLYLSDNQINNLPEAIGGLKSLQILCLRNNHLLTIPESLNNLKALKTLDLSGNNLKVLSESIGNLKFLQELYLEDNNLINLPNSICELQFLQKLLLNWNRLSTLPNSIGKLKSLKILNLFDNQLKELPKSINNLYSLLELNLIGNNVSEIIDSVNNYTSSFQKLVSRGVKIFI